MKKNGKVKKKNEKTELKLDGVNKQDFERGMNGTMERLKTMLPRAAVERTVKEDAAVIEVRRDGKTYSLSMKPKSGSGGSYVEVTFAKGEDASDSRTFTRFTNAIETTLPLLFNDYMESNDVPKQDDFETKARRFFLLQERFELSDDIDASRIDDNLGDQARIYLQATAILGKRDGLQERATDDEYRDIVDFLVQRFPPGTEEAFTTARRNIEKLRSESRKTERQMKNKIGSSVLYYARDAERTRVETIAPDSDAIMRLMIATSGGDVHQVDLTCELDGGVMQVAGVTKKVTDEDGKSTSVEINVPANTEATPESMSKIMMKALLDHRTLEDHQ